MSDQYVVIGIDPGKRTGMFLFSPKVRLGGCIVTPKPFNAWQEFDANEAPKVLHAEIADAVGRYGHFGVHIAVERFIINARTAKLSQQSDALEITGMVKGFAALHCANPVRQYMKANLKFANDEALTRAGWRSPKMRHATDAARQAFALLKDVDYPTWARVSDGGMMESDDRGETT